MSVSINAQTPDSCYVYMQLTFIPTLGKYGACIVMYGNDSNDHEVTDENGNEVRFISFINAINYFSLHGWNMIESYFKPDSIGGKVATLKKKVSLSEAQKVSAVNIKNK
jgi:hypothetical protein